MEWLRARSLRGSIAKAFRARAEVNGMHRRSTAIGGDGTEFSTMSYTLAGSPIIAQRLLKDPETGKAHRSSQSRARVGDEGSS